MYCVNMELIKNIAGLYSHAILVGSPFFGDVLCKKTKYFNEIHRNNSKQSQYYVKCTDNEKNMKKKLFKTIDFL